jgi:hypothetical protein
MTLTRSFLGVWLVALMISLTGCGGTYDATVSGIITLDGKPLPRGTVCFNPDTDGPSAYGLIQSDGKYTLATGREEGLPSGAYTVTVVANEQSVEKTPGATPTPGKPISPAVYRNKNSSPLKYNLEAGSNQIDIPLSSTPSVNAQVR